MINAEKTTEFWKQRAETAEASVVELQDMLVRFTGLESLVHELQRNQALVQSEHIQLREDLAKSQKENIELRAALAKSEEENKLLREALAKSQDENSALQERNNELSALVKGLNRQLYGRKSEKMPPVNKELRDKGDTKPDPKEKEAKRKKNAQARKKLPSEEINHPLLDEEKVCPHCGGTDFHKMPAGEETSEYEYISARVIRRVHIQDKWACKCGECILTAKGTPKVWDGASYGPGLISQIVTAKCVDSIPLYRQAKQFQRLGIIMARATLVFLFHRCAEILEPISEALQKYVASQDIVQADETPMKIQRKKSKGYLWTFLCELAIVYIFSVSRSGKTPVKVLGHETGTLVADAYSGYNPITTPDGWSRAGCLAHVRRKFFDAKSYGEEATTGMDYIRDVYLVEHDARRLKILGTDEHLRLRQERSRPIMDKFHEWLVGQTGLHLPKSPIGKAISYAVKHWKELTVFLDDPRIPPDNNRAENALRIAALGRKNYLFVGHEQGGKNLAGLYSLVMSCQLNDVNPQQYLADVLMRVQTHPASRIEELFPHNWKDLFDSSADSKA